MPTSTTTIDVTYSGTNPYISGLFIGGAWDSPYATLTVEYALMSGSDPYDFSGILTGKSWTASERAAIDAVMAAWEAVTNINLVRTTNTTAANIWYWLGTDAEVGALGWHEYPSSSVVQPLYGAFSYQGSGWDPAGLLPGGYGYLTILHEVGHGLGLAHPHDSGGSSTIFPGVTAPFDDYGDFNMNQGINTVMTYNDGWITQYPSHTYYNVTSYGYNGTPMALDIAAVQAIYGANMSHNTGNDTYMLPDTNGAGTYWSCIWDAGGIDTLSAQGSSRDFTIDLRMATLTGADAGGYVSFSNGIVGGYTIANLVVIENAIGGNGNDTLTGNDAANLLDGGAGNDYLLGGAGTDTLNGGTGADTLDGGAGADVFDGGAGIDVVSYESSTSRVMLDLQNAAFTFGDAVGDSFANVEVFQTGSTADQLRGNASANEFHTGSSSDRLYGRGGNDLLFGEGGADALYGNLGADTMTGGDGAIRDRFIYFQIVESGVGAGNRDIITDFQAGIDRIEIRRFDADTTTGGKQYFDFIGNTAFSNTAGELRYEQVGGVTIVQADVNGDSIADFEIELTGLMTLTTADFFI